jgi:hypothetical protein
MSLHRRAPNGVGQFSSPIESMTTPCQLLHQERESGAPAPRGTTVFEGWGRLVIDRTRWFASAATREGWSSAFNGLSYANRSGHEGSD